MSVRDVIIVRQKIAAKIAMNVKTFKRILWTKICFGTVIIVRIFFMIFLV